MEDILENFEGYRIEKDDNEEMMYEEEGIYYPLWTLSYDNNSCIKFFIIKDKVLIDKVDKCSSNSTSELLTNFVKSLRNINKVVIGDDSSSLKFHFRHNDINISLKYLMLMKYGQSFYNRIGFGKQSEEWKEFINRPFIEYLREIKYGRINDVLVLIENKDETISQIFSHILNYLRFITDRGSSDGIYIDDKYKFDIMLIRDLLDYCFALTLIRKSGRSIRYRERVPNINNDLTYVIR